jgi:hypothetical protein
LVGVTASDPPNPWLTLVCGTSTGPEDSCEGACLLKPPRRRHTRNGRHDTDWAGSATADQALATSRWASPTGAGD